jgi:hypothetical protein
MAVAWTGSVVVKKKRRNVTYRQTRLSWGARLLGSLVATGLTSAAHAGEAPEGAEADVTTAASDPSRVVFSETALLRPARSVNWTVHNLGAHSLDWTFGKHFELGVLTTVPVGHVSVLPHLKIAGEVAGGVHLGLDVFGGLFWFYGFGGGGDFVVAGGGAAPIVTIGDEDLYFNLHVPLAAVAVEALDCDDDDDECSLARFVSAPTIGASWRFAEHVRANLEVAAPLLAGADYPNGEVWVVTYGVRIFGDNLYGDVAFVLPIHEGMGDYIKYVPLGFPLPGLGYQW